MVIKTTAAYLNCLLVINLKLTLFTGNQPSANVQFYSNDYIEQQFGRLARVFVAISNYTKSLVKQNAETGIPVQRPLFMEFPNDTTSWTISYQYMFGSDVLVAPVVATDVTMQKVYLPPGNWKFLWDNTTYHGQTFESVPAPLGKPPVFYKPTTLYSGIFDGIQTQFPLVPPPRPSPTPRHHSVTPSSYSCPTAEPVGVANRLYNRMSLFSLMGFTQIVKFL